MPALLRIFTRVNLLVFVGEEQGMSVIAWMILRVQD
jgi:hypothetical protein